MPSRVALLTGATGFLGGHVASALAGAGWRVRALVRSDPAKAPLLAGVPIEPVRGDLSVATDLAAAAAGCAAIVHVAGLVKARTLEDYREVNVRGTARLVAAAARTAPSAVFVLVSSQAAAGPAREGRPVRPDDPARPVSWYGVSKLEGEEEVRRGWPGKWIVARPGVIYGPGDPGLVAYFRMAARGVLLVPARTRRIQVAPARWVAAALAGAAERADLGGRTAFVCAPDPVTIGGLAAAVAALRTPPAKLLALPDALVRAAGALETLRETATRRSRPFNADKARELLAGEWICEPGLAADLGLPPPEPLERGLREAWNWYRRAGWLPL